MENENIGVASEQVAEVQEEKQIIETSDSNKSKDDLPDFRMKTLH